MQTEEEPGIIGVGTGGARPPQYINQGGPGPPNVGAIKDILTVKLDFFSTFQLFLQQAQVQILTSKISMVIYT